MNVLAPPKARLAIEVVHDLVCPWCYLGVRRLFRTLGRRPDLMVDIAWRPFLLNPDMPRAGMPRADYVVRKFGGEERARRLYSLDRRYRPRRRRHVPLRPHPPHPLQRRCAPPGAVGRALRRGADMVEALFAAHFADGRDIGDPAVLAAIAASCGLRPAAARAYLDSDAETDTVHADNLRAHRLGINGVPCFVVAGSHAIAGAQEPEVIERLLDVAAVEAIAQ